MNLRLHTFTIACLMLAIVARAIAADTQAGGQQYTRNIRVPPDFLITAKAQGKDGLVNVLKAAGVSFPEGSSTVFFPATSQVVAKNTLPNLDAIAALVDKLLNRAPAKPAPAQRGARVPTDITITVQGYELSRKDAAALFQTLDVRLDASALLQQATKARAKIIKLGAVKTTGGARAAIDEKNFSMEVDPVLGPNGRTIDLNLALYRGNRKDEGKRQIISSIALTDGIVFFLGTVEEPGKDAVELIFLRATLSKTAQ